MEESADSSGEKPKKRWLFRTAEERPRNEYRRRIMLRAAGRMLAATLLYWGAVVLYVQVISYTDFGYTLERNVNNILKGLFGSSFAYDFRSNIDIIIISVYIILMIAIPLRILYRSAGHVDRIYAAAAAVLRPESQVPDVPRDVRDIGTALREIKVTMTQSEQSAKEADQRKNDLVVYLAHDLKTPLASIIGYLTLLEEAPELPVEYRAKYTSITLAKAYRLEQLINEFFDITRFSLQSVELDRNRVDLSILFEQIADEFYPVLEEKELSIVLDVEPHLVITGDSDKLGRVFDNLLRNAVNYSYWCTEINVSAYRQDDNVYIRFRNTGDEIPTHKLERLFEKFFRADPARRTSTGGSGLGLAIAKQIIELHGGKITASSSPEYTDFDIVLPIRV